MVILFIRYIVILLCFIIKVCPRTILRNINMERAKCTKIQTTKRFSVTQLLAENYDIFIHFLLIIVNQPFDLCF